MITLCSPFMIQLYGEEESVRVFNMLENLDHELNKIVQGIAYDYFWAREGLSIQEKSLVTVSSLLAMRKARQTRPHIIGYLNTGGSREEIIAVLLDLSRNLGGDIGENGLDVLVGVLEGFGESVETIKIIESLYEQYKTNIDLEIKFVSERVLQLARVSGFVAIGDLERAKVAMRDNACSESDLRNLLLHLIVYCGFPTVINGFHAYKSLDGN